MALIVKKSVTVPLPPDRAFDLFTARMAEWWPLETHSVSGNSDALDPAITVTFGTEPGGRIVETLADGTAAEWATVTRWDPPSVFELSWYPGLAETEATRVEVRFTSVSEGTRVEVTHDGFEVRGEIAAKIHAGYDGGWVGVLDRLATGAKASEPV